MSESKECRSGLDLPVKDIPEDVIVSIGDGLQHYLAPIVVQSAPGPNLLFLGSGTFVEVGGMHGLLTAAHVWRRTKNFDNIQLVLDGRVATRFQIPRDRFSAKVLGDAQVPEEWGPDLAFLELSSKDASTIRANKSFVNLSRQRAAYEKRPPNIDRSLWAITGLVNEFSKVQDDPTAKPVTGSAYCRAFVGLIDEHHTVGAYDYLDTLAKLSLLGIPGSFGGVSGGGLWQVNLSMDRSKTISWDRKLHFRGVAFWESDPSDGHRVIRCHGPHSVFDKAWTEWCFPKTKA